MKLDIGCGTSKKEGFLGVDILELPDVNVVHDLNVFPYPFKDSEVDEIWMDQVLEHLNEPLKVIEELYRICKNGASITIGVPYFRSFYATIDPTHKNFFGIHWFDYFDPKSPFCQRYQYSKVRFNINKIEFDREWVKKSFIHSRIVRFAHKHPFLYESRCSHLYPLNSLTFYLKKLNLYGQ
jgi:predicted SAM-dependent methyltransferase